MAGNRDDLEEHDESVRIAVKALDDMRNGTPRNDATTSSAPETTPNSPFMSRMSHIPIVNSAIHLYEQGKASSSVVKFGAQVMESSVRTISRPVIDRLPVNVNQLDEFACKQLDRLDRYRRPSTSTPESQTTTHSNPTILNSPPPPPQSHIDNDTPPPPLRLPPQTLTDQRKDSKIGEKPKTWKGKSKSWLQPSSPFVGRAPSPPSDLEPSADMAPSSPPSFTAAGTTSDPGAGATEERQVIQRSRWQAVLLEAGGLSAAFSEESMRKLKYCLQWLQYATAHIDAQILILRDFTASLQPLPPSPSSASPSAPSATSTSTNYPSPSTPSSRPHTHRTISQAHLRTLTNIRQDIVQTVKQVVDVVSRYAGGALPEPARGRVRGFVLGLPQRWAQRAGAQGQQGGGRGQTAQVGDEDVTERDREREGRDSVTAAAAGTGGVGVGAVRRGNRRRERGPSGASGTPASSRAASPLGRYSRLRDQDERERDSGASASASGSASGVGSSGAGAVGEHISAGAAIITAQRILTLATESLDMMRGVTGVVKDSLDRADAWVGRLRTVGIQQRRGENDNVDVTNVNAVHNEEELQNLGSNPNYTRHRRRTSSGSNFDEYDGMPSPYSGTSLSSRSSFSYFTGGGAGGATASSSSSVPSTPGTGTGTHTPVHGFSSGYGYGYGHLQGQGQGQGHTLGGGAMSNPLASPNLMGLGLGSMTLEGHGGGGGGEPSSLYGTPNLSVTELPLDGDEKLVKEEEEAIAENEGGGEAVVKGRGKEGRMSMVVEDVKIVGTDIEGEEEGDKGVGKMDVDV